MKKFLLFLVSIVVVVSISLTTYYFVRNNEVITIKTKEIYCNAGDIIPLKSLGISIKNANISKKTTFNYNAGGVDVEKFIKYDEESNSFVVSEENAGEVKLVIRTSNKKYADFIINVHIGNGSVENPYFIFNETELARIGSIYRLDKNYILMSDIALSSDFQPIGFNTTTNTWDGFNGMFDGNGHVVNGLNISNFEADNVGFFSSLGANSVVKNLTLNKATISGEYANAGVLAGVVNGDVEKIVVKNSSITNIKDNSLTGSVAGKLAGDMKLSYAENVTINVGDENNSINAVVGGLVGSLDKSTLQASYTNEVKINTTNATVKAGGLVGLMVVGTENGSIQQSYANTISSDVNFGAFIGEISSSSVETTKANMLRHLIGNIAIVYGKQSQANIEDADLVKNYDADFFKNSTYADRSAFFDKESALYLVRGFISAGEVVSTNEFVYYAIDMNTITSWDTTYVWDVTNNSLPTLKMGNIYPASPTSEYFRRNLAQKDLGNKETFLETFKTDVENQSIKLLDNVDLTSGWTPVNVTNTTIDGNNKTITINLNNAVDGNLGLFKTIDNSTIKNLNIVVTGVSANASNAGALAASIISSDSLTSSSIENVTISYQNFATPVITNFGGIAGNVENTIISNCSVSGLAMNAESKVENAGALVGVVANNAQIKDCSVEATIYATKNVGGLVALNEGAISNVEGTVNVNFNATTDSTIGGIVSSNKGTISDVKVTANIKLENAGGTQNVGGIAGINDGTIQNTVISGDYVSVLVKTTNRINIGGVVALNNGTISNVVNNISTVGSYFIGANHYVAGVVAVNAGKVSEVLTQSNLNGNYVSGVVAVMNNANATIDQVAAGKYDTETKTLSKNEIKGDKYVAGIVVDFRSGKITNIQSASNITGLTNETRSSLVALIFPYGATLKNATIDSSLNGYGTMYRETWTDFAAYSNKAEFGFSAGETGDARFNIYKNDTHHGVMQSVVINSANKGVSSAIAAMGEAFAWGKDYQDTEYSSYVKVVNSFFNVLQFQGSYEFVCATSIWLGIEHKVTKTLTFSIGIEWESNNGISLMFLNNID